MNGRPLVLPRVLVTGASGFAGGYLVRYLAAQGFYVRAASRRGLPVSGVEATVLPDLTKDFDAGPLVEGMDVIVHLAGIAHATSAIPEAVYHAVNANAARTLAAAARKAGARQFILMSSVRAQSGPSSSVVLTEAIEPQPTDAYGRSKLLAEQAVAAVLRGSATDCVALRPVLIYGPGVKGNMSTLERLARSAAPLPFGGFTAGRSLLSLRNLGRAIEHCLEMPEGASGTYLVADASPVSVAGIITALRAGLGRTPGLFSVPTRPIELALRIAGRTNAADRLFGDLVVDTRALRATGWAPQDDTAAALSAWMRASTRRCTAR